MAILQKIFYLLLAASVFCIPAFYNGFPLMFPDTTGYIVTGFTNEIGYARVWLYGGFIRHISLFETLWLVVFAQGFLLSGTLYLIFKYFFKHPSFHKFALVYALIIGTTTAAAFHVSMLMPDIFTPIVILSFSLLLFAKQMSKRDVVLVCLLFGMATGMHNSHFVLNLGLILSLAFLMLFKQVRLLLNEWGITIKKILSISALIFCTHLLVCTLHYSKGGEFKATRGGQIFLFARLCDFDIAQGYLKENCGKSRADSLCNHLETLGWSAHFLWAKGSFFNKTGGWSMENEAYYGSLVADILTTPKYFKKYLIKSIETTLMQFFYYEMDPTEELHAVRANLVKRFFSTYFLTAKNSRQIKRNYSRVSIEHHNAVQHAVIMFSMLCFLFLLWDEKYSKYQKGIALFILASMLINAFIVAATSGVYGRYQSRVAWLITLPAFWFVCSKVEAWRKAQILKIK
jgi:hypothetical protein